MDLKTGGIAAAAAFGLSLLIGLLSRSTMPLLIVWPFVFALVFFVLVIVAKLLFNQFLPELLNENSGSDSNLFPGAMVNIMESDNPGLADDYSSDDSQEPGAALSLQASDALSNAARPDDSDKSIGDISALSEVAARKKAASIETSEGVLTGMDQNMENGYNSLGDLGNFSESTPSLEAAAFGEAQAPMAPSAKAAAKPAKSKKPAKTGSSAWFSDSDDSLPDLDSMAGVFANVTAEDEPETANYSESSSAKKSSSKGQALEGDFGPKEYAEGIRTVLSKDKEE